jgi:hypothetical protein
MPFEKGNKLAEGNPNSGRDPFFQTVEEFDSKVDEYFNSGIRTKTIWVGKGEHAQEIEVPVPTITGLCLFMGFCSRQSFYDYGKKDVFSYSVKRAGSFIEREYEEQLQVGNTTGAIFALKNMGWKDRQEIENTNFNHDVKPLSKDEIEDARRELNNGL